ncbi:putative PurR-regulated permease PerM [Ezakiella coagulans]|uniref:Putative PurR-regulated permease PerM n=1 Tax=Ezakiella coagulans TaxID=46507 RepID=A0A2U1E4N2_9FIRM|nr:AI-2E family transporter [Ezakiella coagulans]PVY94897.1 putative PurR-regulated permease PerM [Ezakiella coagulans]
MDKLNQVLKIQLPRMSLESGIKIALMILSLIFVMFATYYMVNIGNNYVDDKRKVRLDLRKILKYVLIFAGITIVVAIFKSYNSLRYLLNAFLTSVVIAYVLNPLVKWLEKRYPKVKRQWWILIIFLALFLILVFMMVSLLPRTISEFSKLINNFPIYLEQAKKIIIDLSHKHFGRDVLNLEKFQVRDIFGKLGMSNFDFSSMLVGVKSTFSKIFIAILVPIFVFYLLNDKEIFIKKLKELIPDKYREQSIEIGKQMDMSVFKYVKGKILMAVYVGVAVGIFLGIIGVDFALVIGIITMFADIIPYIGPFLGLAPATVFALLDSPTKAIFVIIMFLFLQWTENNIVGPKIMSDQLGYHPMIVLIITIAGGFLFGFIGMIFALPLVIAIEVVYRYYMENIKAKKKLD